jgi:hypothetical protein
MPERLGKACGPGKHQASVSNTVPSARQLIIVAKSILTIELLEREPGSDPPAARVFDVVPIDCLPGHIAGSVESIQDLHGYIDRFVRDPIAREAVKTRVWFVLNYRCPTAFYRFSTAEWKWDAEYFANFVPKHKGIS